MKSSTRFEYTALLRAVRSSMTEAEFRDALRLIDFASTLLHHRSGGARSRAELLRRVRELMVQFDLLRVRLAQAPTESQRN